MHFVFKQAQRQNQTKETKNALTGCMTIRLRSDFPETLSLGLRQSTESFGLIKAFGATKAFGARSIATGKEEFGGTVSASDSAHACLSC